VTTNAQLAMFQSFINQVIPSMKHPRVGQSSVQTNRFNPLLNRGFSWTATSVSVFNVDSCRYGHAEWSRVTASHTNPLLIKSLLRYLNGKPLAEMKGDKVMFQSFISQVITSIDDDDSGDDDDESQSFIHQVSNLPKGIKDHKALKDTKVFNPLFIKSIHQFLQLHFLPLKGSFKQK
jgi:hypothetical protein